MGGSMNTRREFIKTTATGALILGSRSKLGLAAMLDQKAQHAESAKSKVVVARDPSLHGPGSQLDDKRVLDLLDRAIAAYTGRDHPIEAWKRIVPVGKVIGLKTNGLGGRGISTHLALVLAIAERLQQAGVLTINTDPSRIRCHGYGVAGFEDQPATWGTASVKFSKILPRECDMV